MKWNKEQRLLSVEATSREVSISLVQAEKGSE